jgi:hypothetical protein
LRTNSRFLFHKWLLRLFVNGLAGDAEPACTAAGTSRGWVPVLFQSWQYPDQRGIAHPAYEGWVSALWTVSLFLFAFIVLFVFFFMPSARVAARARGFLPSSWNADMVETFFFSCRR